MNIRKSDPDIRMLVRTEGKHIKEFLIVGGGKDNLLIQVKGNICPVRPGDSLLDAKTAGTLNSKCKMSDKSRDYLSGEIVTFLLMTRVILVICTGCKHEAICAGL
jgi:hypothetical protein